MPQEAWSDKRERQYEHIKEGLLERGSGEEKAEEIAARTVNKERARHGEAKEASRTSIHDLSSGRRGDLRSHRGSGGPTDDQPDRGREGDRMPRPSSRATGEPLEASGGLGSPIRAGSSHHGSFLPRASGLKPLQAEGLAPSPRTPFEALSPAMVYFV